MGFGSGVADVTKRVGRPTKYQRKYCDAIVEHMREGASMTAFAAEIGVHRGTLNEWMGVHPEFSEAVKKGKATCAAWWEKRAREGALGAEQGNATLIIFGLKNMASDDWADTKKHEISGPGGGPVQTISQEMTPEEAAAAYAATVTDTRQG